MKSRIPFIALMLALVVSACGSSENTTSNLNANTASGNASAMSNASNANNTSNTSSTSTTGSSQPNPMDQIDKSAKIENGKSVTPKDDVTLTLPADWKKGPNQYVSEYLGKTKDGKKLRLLVYWDVAEEKYKGLGSQGAAMAYLKDMRELAEKDESKSRPLPRILALEGSRIGVVTESKSATVDDWSWVTFDDADFSKGISFQYPAGTFEQHKSIRDGILNSLKFKR